MKFDTIFLCHFISILKTGKIQIVLAHHLKTLPQIRKCKKWYCKIICNLRNFKTKFSHIKCINDLCLQNDILETLFIEIDKDQLLKKQNIIIGVIYRPPDTDIKEFNDQILRCLTQIKAEKKIAYLLGDYNINLLNTEKHAASQDFADVMFSHSFFPHHYKANSSNG